VLFEEGAIPALGGACGGRHDGAGVRKYSVNALLGLAVNSKACLAAIDEEGISASIDVLTRTGSSKDAGQGETSQYCTVLHRSV